jgi:hypothetical protein
MVKNWVMTLSVNYYFNVKLNINVYKQNQPDHLLQAGNIGNKILGYS